MIDKNILYNLISCCDAYDEATHPDHAYNSYKILLDILIQNNYSLTKVQNKFSAEFLASLVYVYDKIKNRGLFLRTLIYNIEPRQCKQIPQELSNQKIEVDSLLESLATPTQILDSISRIYANQGIQFTPCKTLIDTTQILIVDFLSMCNYKQVERIAFWAKRIRPDLPAEVICEIAKYAIPAAKRVEQGVHGAIKVMALKGIDKYRFYKKSKSEQDLTKKRTAENEPPSKRLKT